jgi:hypothetical protein
VLILVQDNVRSGGSFVVLKASVKILKWRNLAFFRESNLENFNFSTMYLTNFVNFLVTFLQIFDVKKLDFFQSF